MLWQYSPIARSHLLQSGASITTERFISDPLREQETFDPVYTRDTLGDQDIALA